MTTRALVLLVEDDEDIATVLEGTYRRAGFDVRRVGDGRHVLRALFEAPVDLVVLDIGLPGLDGFEVLQRIREATDVPVMMLTARAEETDKVAGLMAGADDYLTKPFSNRELVARSLALLRRARPDRDHGEVLVDGTVEIDFGRRQVRIDGTPVDLTPTDWNLLVAFARRPGLVLSPGQLLEIAWNDPLGIGPERVKFAVLRLRRRLGWTDPATSPIQSVRGFGYRYVPRNETSG
jgi:DNA-binding response OmpR family regulator